MRSKDVKTYKSIYLSIYIYHKPYLDGINFSFHHAPLWLSFFPPSFQEKITNQIAYCCSYDYFSPVRRDVSGILQPDATTCGVNHLIESPSQSLVSTSWIINALKKEFQHLTPPYRSYNFISSTLRDPKWCLFAKIASSDPDDVTAVRGRAPRERGKAPVLSVWEGLIIFPCQSQREEFHPGGIEQKKKPWQMWN